MILVIGGIASGKREYVMNEYGYSDADLADAVLDERPVIYNLHDLVAINPDGISMLMPELLTKEVVICNEVGCGIVPVLHDERIIRESVGRLCILLAKEAKSVVRLYCGIPSMIKG